MKCAESDQMMTYKKSEEFQRKLTPWKMPLDSKQLGYRADDPGTPPPRLCVFSPERKGLNINKAGIKERDWPAVQNQEPPEALIVVITIKICYIGKVHPI